MSKTKQLEGQMTFEEIEVTSTIEKTTETPPLEVKSSETSNPPEINHINLARVPDSDFEIPKPNNIPTVKDIVKTLGKATYRTSRYEFLSDAFECGAIAISNKFDKMKAPEREENYLRIIKKYDKDMQNFLLETFSQIYLLLSNQINPHVGFDDYLGKIYMQSETSSKKAGQFFTPYNVSKAAAEMTLDSTIINDYMDNDKILTLNEPTCGSGGMILAAADALYNKYHFNISRNLFVACGDIDKRCVHMAYLQLALAGIPAIILHQDALTLETWDRWETPAYIMQYLRFKDCLKMEMKEE